MKGFKQVTLEEFGNFINERRDDLTIKDQYDSNPPLIIYQFRKLQASLRYAYIENNSGAFNGKPNKYYITTNP